MFKAVGTYCLTSCLPQSLSRKWGRCGAAWGLRTRRFFFFGFLLRLNLFVFHFNFILTFHPNFTIDDFSSFFLWEMCFGLWPAHEFFSRIYLYLFRFDVNLNPHLIFFCPFFLSCEMWRGSLPARSLLLVMKSMNINLSPCKVGLCVIRRKVDYQWIPVYEAFHRICFFGKRTNRSVVIQT